MRNFIQPNIEPISDRVYQVTSPWSITWITGDVVNRLNVPAGSRYDGASIPRWLWSITGIRPDGVHRAGTLVHDFIYYYEGVLPIGSMQYRYIGDHESNFQNVTGKWSRRDADKIGYKLWKRAGQPKAKLMYKIVRTFGYFLWKE